MADITISELPSKTSLLDSDIIPIDDGTQTFRVTGAQLREFLKVNFLSVGTVVWSQSNLATDNPGRLPLWTGEYIASASTIYPDFYTWVKDKHPELCKTKEQYDAALTQFGECPFYVVDEEEGSLRLPKLTNYIKMANTADGITQSEAGLPNITGSLVCNSNDFSGAIYSDSNVSGGSYHSATNNPLVEFDASRSSAVYGNSDTVTPAHTTLYPWVFAYNASVPASTAQAAEFQQGLSGKADADLNNTIPSKTFRENVFNWGLPDYTAGVSKTWNTDITAETNGWVRFYGNLIDDQAAMVMSINGENVFYLAYRYDAQGTSMQMIPVSKGDVYKCYGASDGQGITFYPCKGETL